MESLLTSKARHLLLEIHTEKVTVKCKRKEFDEIQRQYHVLKRVRPGHNYDLDKYMKELTERFKPKGWWR